MPLNDSSILKALAAINPHPNFGGTHYICDCPYCGKNNHLYIQRQTRRRTKRGKNASWYWDCKRCKESGWIKRLVLKIGTSSTLFGDGPSAQGALNKLISLQETTTSVATANHVPNEEMPLGFKQIHNHPYLSQRHFQSWQYNEYYIGITNLESHLRNYIVFGIYQNETLYGWVARSTSSKSAIKQYEQETGKKYLRYINSETFEKSTVLWGYDEITSKTKGVILVEGIFDKAAVDRVLRERGLAGTLVCCCCFGKSLSLAQISLLQQRLNVKYIILWFDPDAIADMKQQAHLTTQFKVQVIYTNEGDPDELQPNRVYELIMRGRKDFLQFYLGQLSKIT